MHWRVLALRLLDHFTDDRLKLEQLHLRLRKFFSARSIYFSIRIGPRKLRLTSPVDGILAQWAVQM
jgi:hypothetical protein